MKIKFSDYSRCLICCKNPCQCKDNITKCKWCNKTFHKRQIKEHEENCDLNDGGKSDMNYEGVADKYF